MMTGPIDLTATSYLAFFKTNEQHNRLVKEQTYIERWITKGEQYLKPGGVTIRVTSDRQENSLPIG